MYRVNKHLRPSDVPVIILLSLAGAFWCLAAAIAVTTR